MSAFKIEFVKDFFEEYPDKDVLRDFIQTLPLSAQEKKLLAIRYCREQITVMKVVAFEMGVSERYAKTMHKDIIQKSLPYINLFFIKALETSPTKDK